MSLRCALGLHRWKPVVRRLEQPRFCSIVIAFWLHPNGIEFPWTIKFRRVGEQCVRCRKRKPA